MPENKKHHYVPQFYLKKFSQDKKSISLYNLKSERKIIGANLKNQCYKDYFYGKEQVLEHSLGDIETVVAQIFNLVDQAGVLPPPDSPDYILLILFILIQHGRTKYSADALDEMTDKMMKHIYGPMAEKEGIDLSKVKIGLTNVAHFSVSLAAQNYPILLDLHYKLLKNCTDVEFVTSDNPVVLYNQFMAFRRHSSNTGLANKGLQIFFPIDPNHVMLLYDPEVYRVGSDKKIVIEITDARDIYEINTLQICSCLGNIYFSDQDFNVKALHKKAKQFLRKTKVRVASFPQYKNKSRKSELLMTSREDIRTNLTLSFLTIRKSAKRWMNKFKRERLQQAAVLRNRQLYEDHREFVEAVKKKQYNPDDFFKFMSEKHDQS